MPQESKIGYFVLSLGRSTKRLLVLSLDIFLLIVSVLVAYYLRLDHWVGIFGPEPYKPYFAIIVGMVLMVPVNTRLGLYRAMFRYSGRVALNAIFKASAIYGTLFFAIVTLFSISGVPRTIGVIQPLLLLVLISLSRAFARHWLGGVYSTHRSRDSLPRYLIYGAGVAGQRLASAMENNNETLVVGLLDDDEKLHGLLIDGMQVFSPHKLEKVIEDRDVDTVLLAMPNLNRKRRHEILNGLRSHRVSVRTIPGVVDLAQGKISFSDTNDLDIDDLLTRVPVEPDANLLRKNVAGKVVAVTGAAGSIGSELCRQIVKNGASVLLMIDQSEFSLYEVHGEICDRVKVLKQQGIICHDVNVVRILASVQDQKLMGTIFDQWRPTTIYHAAAYKHVPLVEENPREGIRNNVLGTKYTALAAKAAGVENFVLVSTDKAVRPTNIMGASKRLAEMTLQALALDCSATTFSMVRFGNVLGSSGSVVPRFRRQIRDGGPITLTHKDVTRFFMTIPEAAGLVLQAGAMANGGDVFVLDMGEPVKIHDLAVRMVQLSGLCVWSPQEPDGDIEIAVTGLRPGEKLHEELLIGNDPAPTSHERIMTASEDLLEWSALEARLQVLLEALDVGASETVRALLQELVSGYQAASGDSSGTTPG